MHFAFTDEQEMLRAAVRGALERSRSLAQVRAAFDGEPLSPASLGAEQGWAGIGVDEDAGGQGGGLIELAIVVEELGRAVAPDPLLASAGLGVPLLCAFGGDPQAVVRAADGSVLVVPALSAGELPGLGGLTVAASPAAGGWTLSGDVAFVLEAPAAGVLLVPADPGGGAELFAVDAGAPGVAVEPVPMTDGTRELATVGLRDAPATRLSGDLEAALATVAARAAVLIAADALGCCRRMLDLTVEYVVQREQFGRPVGSFQAVKHIAADMLVDIESAHSTVYHAAWSVENATPDHALHAAAAKALTSDVAVRVADNALALHGAVGFTWEHDLHLFMKRARADAVMFGDAGRQRERVAGALELSRAPALL